MFKIVKDCLTDQYGKDYDFASVCAFVGAINGFVLFDLHVLTKLAPMFDFQAYSIAYGCIMAAVLGGKRFNPTPIVPDISKQ